MRQLKSIIESFDVEIPIQARGVSLGWIGIWIDTGNFTKGEH